MSGIIQRVPWTVQPQVAVGIGRGNPLTQGLVFLENAAVSNALTTGSPTVKATPKGQAFSGLSATNYRSRQQPIPITSAKEVTVIVVASATVNSASNFLFGVGSSTDTNSFVGIGTSTFSSPGFWLRDTAATDQNIGFGSYDGVMRVYGGVCSNAGNRFEFWTSAGLAASAAATTKTTFTGLNRVAFGCIVRSSASNGVLNPTIAMAAVWGRALSAKEMADVVANPWQLFAPLPRTIWAPAAATDPALTSNLATTSGGILVPTLSLAVSGNSVTASRGTPVAALSLAGTGSAATATQGTPVASISLALTGQGVTATQGSVGVTGSNTAALTGNAATTAQGTPVASLSLAVTGNAATAAQGTMAPELSLAGTGSAATATQGTPVASISLALSGQGATTSAGTVAVPGLVIPTGVAATASQGTVSPGITVALTGNAVTASRGTASPAISLALSGLAGTSAAGIVVPGLSAALSGNAATSAAGSTVPATGNVTLALTGNSATATVGAVGLDEGLNSAWWTYSVAADDLTYAVAADDLTYAVGPDQLSYEIGV